MIEVRIYRWRGDPGKVAGCAWTWAAALAISEAELLGLARAGEAADAWTELEDQGVIS